MAKTIAVCNLKGGVGKTTVAVNLAAVLSDRYSVALVDADEQASASDWLTEPGKVQVYPWAFDAGSARELDEWTRKVGGLSVDVVVIDCPPHLNAVTGAALGLADVVLLPCGPSVADVRATARTVELIREARKMRRGKPAAVIVPNRLDRRTTTGRGFALALAALDERVGPELVTRQAHADATGSGVWVGAFAPGSPAASEVAELARIVDTIIRKG